MACSCEGARPLNLPLRLLENIEDFLLFAESRLLDPLLKILFREPLLDLPLKLLGKTAERLLLAESRLFDPLLLKRLLREALLLGSSLRSHTHTTTHTHNHTHGTRRVRETIPRTAWHAEARALWLVFGRTAHLCNDASFAFFSSASARFFAIC